LSEIGTDPRLRPESNWLAAALLFTVAAAIWLPALNTPFWGDDYVFLYNARTANLSSEPWWSVFWPETPYNFWRPLAQESWWRLVDAWLYADSYRVHAANLALLVIAGACVGSLGGTLAHACGWSEPGGVGLLSAIIYASLALHLLPVHWAAAANNSILVVFTSLTLSAWVAAFRAGPLPRVLLRAAAVLLLIAALLSRESAALIPLLMAVLTLFVGARVGRVETAVWTGCLALVGIWFLLRTGFTADSDARYDFVLGANLARNGLSFIAWLLNVPREALRLLTTGGIYPGLLWIGMTSVPMALAWVMAVRAGLDRITPRQGLLTFAFAVIAYLPYFPLAWNSYAYYAAIAAMLPVIVMARCIAGRRLAVMVLALIGISSWLAVAGTRWLDHPGLIGRARWAEASLQSLEAAPNDPPLYVRVDDPQRFYAIGTAGLAWRLNLDRASIRVVDQCPEDSHPCLVISSDGGLSWRGNGSAPP
jgi:hypothetical protein